MKITFRVVWTALLMIGLGCGASTSAPNLERAASADEGAARKPASPAEPAPESEGKPEVASAPALAVAPFTAEQARRHQEAWARHLGQPVEVVNSIGMKLTLIPPGEFMMGSPAGEANRFGHEGPQHRVRLTQPYYLGMYEVTQGEYERVMGTNPSHFSLSREDTSRFPVEWVSWEDAMEFCRKLSALPGEQSSGRVYRLPTEAEWEYACRAGTTTPFHFGPELTAGDANYARNLGRPTTVGSYAPNAFGLYDMHGNVWEWCADWYASGYYANSPQDDPPGPVSGSFRVYRGGSWYGHARGCRSAYRSWRAPDYRDDLRGFRVALVRWESME